MNFEIKNSLDWSAVRTAMMEQSRKLPMFSHDFRKFLNSIDDEIKNISTMEVDIRRQPRPSLVKRHEDSVNQVNKKIKLFMKHFTMALLRYS
jgi:hypothetical protein